MDFRIERVKLKEDLEKLTSLNDGRSLRGIGSDSSIMANHNLLAEAFLKAACDLGVDEAYTDLGVLYNHHFEVPNREKGFENYLIAARLGDKRAIRLYVRDSAWYNDNKDIDEILDLAIKFNEPSGVSEYAFKLINDGNVEKGMEILETIQYEDPKVLIELAVLDIQESKDVSVILDRLIKFNEFWYKDILEINQVGGLGDDAWFFYYFISEEEPAMEYFRLLPMILKAAANEGNMKAAFAYSVFSFVGICMTESNMEDYKDYLNKAIEGGIENKEEILKNIEEYTDKYEFGIIEED